MIKQFTFPLSIKDNNLKKIGTVVANDVSGNKFLITLMDGSRAFDITGHSNITFTVLKPDGTLSIDSEGTYISVVDAEKGIISIVLVDEAIDVAGFCKATVEVYANGLRVSSSRIGFDVVAELSAGADVTGDSNYPVLVELIDAVNDVVSGLPAKADKVAGAILNNFAGLDANGNLKDSGSKASDFATATGLSDEITARQNADTSINNSLSAHTGNTSNAHGINNKADLIDGKIPATQLPSYVDDVVEYANTSAFPVTGEAGKIYVALDTNLTYRWGGSTYAEISPSLALGETSSTAHRGDRGETAYDHSQVITGNPHGSTTSDIPESTDKNYVTDIQKTKLAEWQGRNIKTVASDYTLLNTDDVVFAEGDIVLPIPTSFTPHREFTIVPASGTGTTVVSDYFYDISTGVAPASYILYGQSITSNGNAADAITVWTNGEGWFIKSINQVEVSDKFSAVTTPESYTGIVAGSIRDIFGQIKKFFSNILSLFSDTKDPTGFIDADNMTVAYDSTARTITLTNANGIYYYWRGIKYRLGTGTTWTSDPHINNTTTDYFLKCVDGVNFIWSDTAWIFSDIQVAKVAKGRLYAIKENHSLSNWNDHEEAHWNIGAYRANNTGADVTGFTFNSTTAANRRPTIGALTIADEDCKTPLSQQTDNYCFAYLSGATGVLNYSTDQSDILRLNGNIPYWNNFTGGAWTEQALGANDYMNLWLLAIPVTADVASQKYRYVWLQGQASGSLTSTQAKTTLDVNLGELSSVTEEVLFLQRVIVRYTAGNWVVIQSNRLTGSSRTQNTGSSGNFLSQVATDGTLTGNGTAGSPLGVAYTNYGKKVAEYTVSGSTTSFVKLSGFDLQADGGYIIIIDGTTMSSQTEIRCLWNDDLSDAGNLSNDNLYTWAINVGSAINNASVAQSGTGEFRVFLEVSQSSINTMPFIRSIWEKVVTATYTIQTRFCWRNSLSANITKIGFYTGGISFGDGTKFTVFKRGSM
jgi:hypothetical protein